MDDLAERPSMLHLHRTYGKTTHTWRVADDPFSMESDVSRSRQYDIHPHIPLGPPQIMLAYTGDGQVDQGLLAERDRRVVTARWW